MRRAIRLRVSILLLCALFFLAKGRAAAQLDLSGLGPSPGQVAAIIVAGVLVTAAIVVGIYYVARRPSMTGCVVSSPDGPRLQNEKDRQTYLLTGDIADVKPGDRVRVKGRKKKDQRLLVEKFLKDFGACPARRAAP